MRKKEGELMALTEKRKLFADEYLIDLNASRAYKAAYPRVKDGDVAAAAASRLLKDKDVAKYIEIRMQERSKRTEITQDWVLEELRKIASVNGADFAKVVIGPEGPDIELIPTDDLSEDKKAAISAIKQGRFGISVESYDRVKALELLGRHLGMFKDHVEVSGLDEEKSKLDDLINQMRGG